METRPLHFAHSVLTLYGRIPQTLPLAADKSNTEHKISMINETVTEHKISMINETVVKLSEAHFTKDK